MLRWADLRGNLVAVLSLYFSDTFASCMEKVEFPYQCGLEFHRTPLLRNLGASPEKSSIAEGSVPDCFQSYFILRYFYHVFYFTDPSVSVHGKK